MGDGVWPAVAIAAGAADYLAYRAGLDRQFAKPDRTSWLIWSGLSASELGRTAACAGADIAARVPANLLGAHAGRGGGVRQLPADLNERLE